MKQIYTNTTERIYLKIYSNGVLADASQDPAFSLLAPGETVPRTGTAEKESTGVYYVITNIDEADVEGVLSVTWDYNIAGDDGQRTDYISVVTPYVSFQQIKAMYPDQTDAEIEHAELFSRYMINAYTGVEFGMKSDVVTMFGNGQKTLVLPYRLERLDSIAVNDEVLLTRDPEVNETGRNISITDTHYGLLSEKADSVPPSTEFADIPVWKKNYKYAIGGLYGWANIPDEVEYSAKVLADDYFCQDTAWKKKFVDQINASDWRIVFNDRQYLGTGNFFVDKMLYGYKSIGMVLV